MEKYLFRPVSEEAIKSLSNSFQILSAPENPEWPFLAEDQLSRVSIDGGASLELLKDTVMSSDAFELYNLTSS